MLENGRDRRVSPATRSSLGSGNPTSELRLPTALAVCDGGSISASSVAGLVDEHSEPDQLGHAAGIQLLHQAAPMFLNRFDTEAQFSSHYLIGVACGTANVFQRHNLAS